MKSRQVSNFPQIALRAIRFNKEIKMREQGFISEGADLLYYFNTVFSLADVSAPISGVIAPVDCPQRSLSLSLSANMLRTSKREINV